MKKVLGKIESIGIAIFVLLFGLHCGNEAYTKFISGVDFFGMIIASLLALGSIIILTKLPKELS